MFLFFFWLFIFVWFIFVVPRCHGDALLSPPEPIGSEEAALSLFQGLQATNQSAGEMPFAAPPTLTREQLINIIYSQPIRALLSPTNADIKTSADYRTGRRSPISAD